MNSVDYYNRQKETCSQEELDAIKTEYEINKLTISEIADIHRRTPGSISYKIRSLGLVTDNKEARGYVEYRNGDLYKQIVENGKIRDFQKKEKKIKAIKKPIPDNLQSIAIKEIQNEIASLKKDVKEILSLLNAIYEFENK